MSDASDDASYDAFGAARAAADTLARASAAPAVAVVLGSGLGSFADTLADARAFDYAHLPGFPKVGVAGHAGRLVVGRLGEVRVAALQGRAHFYEGHAVSQVVHAVRTLRLWGVRGLVLTNAAGGIAPGFRPGDLMRITDHLNLTGANPLNGPNDARFGPRFPDMTHAYDPALGACLTEAAETLDLSLQAGVYAGLSGPSYETPAEIRMLRTMGADAVGMSTVLEVIAGVHAGLRVAGISCITNLAAGTTGAALTHDEVQETANHARAAFEGLLREALPRIAGVVS